MGWKYLIFFKNSEFSCSENVVDMYEIYKHCIVIFVMKVLIFFKFNLLVDPTLGHESGIQ